MRLGNVVSWLAHVPTNIYNRLLLKYKHISLPKSSKINGKIYIYGSGTVTIQDNTRINSCLESDPIGGDTHTIFNTCANGRIEIGRDVGISNSTIVAREKVTIADGVRIGGGCRIYDTDFHSLSYEMRVSENDTDIATRPIRVDNGAFIGAGVIILKGVTVGEKSVVGAGSVVTKSIPPYEIWGGNPAKFIRKL